MPKPFQNPSSIAAKKKIKHLVILIGLGLVAISLTALLVHTIAPDNSPHPHFTAQRFRVPPNTPMRPIVYCNTTIIVNNSPMKIMCVGVRLGRSIYYVQSQTDISN